MTDVTIRLARGTDLDTIVDFNTRLADETEQKQLAAQILRTGVQKLLVDGGKGRYFIAECDDRVAGQIMLTYEWSDWRDGMIWWIQSVYVAPEYRGRGIFRQLFEHVRELARHDDTVCGLRLYVHRGNDAARGVYRALGMTDTDYDVMEQLI